MKILAIAHNTFRESLRNKTMYGLLIFSLLLILLSRLPTDLGKVPTRIIEKPRIEKKESKIYKPEERLKIESSKEKKEELGSLIKKGGFILIGFFGTLIAILITMEAIPSELKRGTINTIVAKPVERYKFILGKFLGSAAIVLINISLMTIGLWFVVYHRTGFSDLTILKGISVIIPTFLIFISLTIMFSTFLSETLSGFTAFIFSILGNYSKIIKDFSNLSLSVSSLKVKVTTKILYFVAPKTDNIKSVALDILERIPMDKAAAWRAELWGILYIIVTLVLAILIFQRKEL